MPKTKFKMDKGLIRIDLALDPKKMDAAMRRRLNKATRLNGKFAEKEARRVIQSGSGLENNAALTAAIKGGDKAGVGLTAEMFRAITSTAINDTTGFVGVLRTDESFNVAQIVHDGTTIPVTKAMKGMFFFLWKASIGELDPSKLTGRARELWGHMDNGWKPIKDSTTAIVVPSRPFLEIAFQSTALKKKVKANWLLAVQGAVRERASQ